MINKDFDTIFLQVDPEEDLESGRFEMTWCVDEINDTDIEYVRADIVMTAMDVLKVPRTSEIYEHEQQAGKMSTIIFSVPARVSLMVERWNYERKRKIEEDEKRTREEQGQKIASMVRQSRRLSEKEEEGLYPSADEIANLESARWRQSKQRDELPETQTDHRGLREVGTEDD